ncbi:hypothetical protein QBC47DRAFT_403501 [Echria macrotheca]|uniref:PDZ domain-containing protein n=1 Tax=Echria macrotheca TaxID=438768 RepID=A0AAJ0F541_9PEZI|nr:hypothetical protein QBC47DRAFT_403501 [Echria macrotheca]
MDLWQGPIVWANATLTKVAAVTIDDVTISAADIKTWLDPESRILPVIFDTVSSSDVGPLGEWKKQGRFGVGTYLRVKAARESCGLQNGDIVVEADGQPVPTSLSFKSQNVSVTAVRDGRATPVIVETIPQSKFERVWSASWSGLILQPAPFEQSILMKEVPRGLHVSGVQPGSPAASWGITAPSYLLKINREEVLDKERFLELIRGLLEGTNGDLFSSHE